MVYFNYSFFQVFKDKTKGKNKQNKQHTANRWRMGEWLHVASKRLKVESYTNWMNGSYRWNKYKFICSEEILALSENYREWITVVFFNIIIVERLVQCFSTCMLQMCPRSNTPDSNERLVIRLQQSSITSWSFESGTHVKQGREPQETGRKNTVSDC